MNLSDLDWDLIKKDAMDIYYKTNNNIKRKNYIKSNIKNENSSEYQQDNSDNSAEIFFTSLAVVDTCSSDSSNSD